MAFALAAASTLFAASGALQQGESAKAAADYNARNDAINAAIVRQQGVAAVEQMGRAQARRAGAMVAAYGAAGVQVDTGSPMDVLADSARSAELDKLTTQYNYELKARGYDVQAGLDTAAGENALRAGRMNATSALLTGGSKAAAYGMPSGTPIPTFGSPLDDFYHGTGTSGD